MYEPMLVSLLLRWQWLLLLSRYGCFVALILNEIDLYHLYCNTSVFRSPNNVINQPTDMYDHYCYYYFVCWSLFSVYRNTNDPSPVYLTAAVQMRVVQMMSMMMVTSAVVAL